VESHPPFLGFGESWKLSQGSAAQEGDSLFDAPERDQGGNQKGCNGDVIRGVHGYTGEIQGSMGRGGCKKCACSRADADQDAFDFPCAELDFTHGKSPFTRGELNVDDDAEPEKPRDNDACKAH